MAKENTITQEGICKLKLNSEDEKPQSSGNLVVKTHRNELGRFVSGHPKLGGTRRGYVSPRKVLNNKLQEIQEITIGDKKEKMTGMEILAEVLFKKAVDGDLGAIREFFDRIEGRPKQIGLGEQLDGINFTQVFQQIFKENEKAKKQTE